MSSGHGQNEDMTSPVRAYYHLYAQSGRWPLILRNHLRALGESGIEWDLVVGVVGNRAQVQRVRSLLPETTRVYAWPDGFEQRTLNILVDDLQAGFRGPVMYAHSKGAGYPLHHSAWWRTCMTNRVVRDAKVCLDHLTHGADTVGAHWMTPEEWPHVDHFGDTAFYGGNFWWATSEHLAKLGRPSDASRFDAERWIGTVRPENPVNLAPGWPGTSCKTHM